MSIACGPKTNPHQRERENEREREREREKEKERKRKKKRTTEGQYARKMQGMMRFGRDRAR